MGRYKKSFKNNVILMVTNDELELPITLFETCEEMMKFTGKCITSCYNALSKGKVDKKNNCKYIKVELSREVE